MEIKIKPEIKYQIELPEGIYHPAFFDTFDIRNEKKINDNESIEVHYFMVNEDNTLSDYMRSIDFKYLKHLDISQIKTKPLRGFIHRGLAELLRKSKRDIEIPKELIKDVSEVKNCEEYFKIFRGDKEPEDIFSRYKGTSIFPKSQKL